MATLRVGLTGASAKPEGGLPAAIFQAANMNDFDSPNLVCRTKTDALPAWP